MRILFVAPYIPSAIRVRPYQWIRALARHGHRIRLVALQPPEDRWVSQVPVNDYCEQVSVFPITRFRTLRNAAMALPQDIPLQAAYSLCPEAERFIAGEASRCDILHVEHLRGSLLARGVQDVPSVIDAVDSITALFEQTVRQARSWRTRFIASLDLARTRRFEAKLPTRFERTIVSSNRDATTFYELAGSTDRVVTLPNGVAFDYFRPDVSLSQSEMVLFTGKMSYHANAAAALRLVRNIMPLVWQQRPSVQLVIAGKDPSTEIRALGRDRRVTVTGFVEDLRPFFRSASVVAAPLVYGTGIQNKVLEAMACGVAVVTSPIACEGIAAVHGRDLLVGANDGEMAGHIVALLRSRPFRTAIGLAGRQFVSKYHDWNELATRLVAIYSEAQLAYRRCA